MCIRDRFVDFVRERELLKRCGGFGKQNDVQRVVWRGRQGQFDRLPAERLDDLKRVAVDVRRGIGLCLLYTSRCV